MNIFLEKLKINIPKLLSLYDLDPTSKTYGYGDREYWAWKTKDFCNATMQGGIHALAISYKLNISNNNKILDIIDIAISAIENIRAKNGSLAEAYPQENSYCVTALVAFDILATIYTLGNLLNANKITKYLKIIRPLITFLCKNNEEHAVISNHLATAAAAIILWNKIANDNKTKAEEILNKIYCYQSEEGWYREYTGADPGYQTLCTYYLAYIYTITKDKKLLQSLEKSADFLSNFIHPDGTIGGLYGSRNTEVYYPAGIVILANEIPTCAVLAKYLNKTIENQHIKPEDIDIGNYIPLINSYAVAGLYYDNSIKAIENCVIQPFYMKDQEHDFKDAGIYLYSNQNYFSILNYKKGGTIKVFDKKTNNLDLEDGGLFGELKNGQLFSTQQFDNTISFDNRTLTSGFYIINNTPPLSPFKFILLRLLSITIFKSVYLGNIFKKFVVNNLMTGKNKVAGNTERVFYFHDDKIAVTEKISPPKNSHKIKHYGRTKSIHMASSGYNLPQHLINVNSKLVEFNICN